MLSVQQADQYVANMKAPKITEEDVDSVIVGSQYWIPAGTTLTICMLTLANGFTVTGESACASPENFDVEVGRTYAYRAAKTKIYALMAYELRTKLTEQGTTFLDRLKKEEVDLGSKLEKLSAYMNSGGFAALEPGHREDLFEQHAAMRQYRTILKRRISKLVA